MSDQERTGFEATSDDAIEVGGRIEEIEGLPVDERAAGYQELAEQLRAALEHSDPTRGEG